MKVYKPGIVYGEALQNLYKEAKEKGFAIPAVNTIGTNSINAVLETAAKVNSPVIIQFSNGGARFIAGQGLDNTDLRANVAGAIAGAMHVHQMAKYYGVPVVLHTDHASRPWLPWVSALIGEGYNYYMEKRMPLFSSHMLDLSEETVAENIAVSQSYFKRMHRIGMGIEIELGVTGGEEDGMDNSEIENHKLYTQPEDVAFAYNELKEIGDLFTIAAAFGNVHGVYSPGNVELKPEILSHCQTFIQQKYNTEVRPVNFVFHGGSGSSKEQIKEAIGYGVIKMNIDTDMQWAFWEGIQQFYAAHEGYLKTQLGNPEGPEKPNKKYYDPRVWLRKGEENFVARLEEAFADLNCINRNA